MLNFLCFRSPNHYSQGKMSIIVIHLLKSLKFFNSSSESRNLIILFLKMKGKIMMNSHPNYCRTTIILGAKQTKQTKESRHSSPVKGYIPLGSQGSRRRSFKIGSQEKLSCDLVKPLGRKKYIKTQFSELQNPEIDQSQFSQDNWKRMKTEVMGKVGKEITNICIDLETASINKDKSRMRSKDLGESKNRKKNNKDCHSKAKLKSRLEKMKQYEVIKKCFTDLQLEGFFNELQLKETPQAKWVLIIIDRAYDFLKHKDRREKSLRITRDFRFEGDHF